MWFLIVSTPDLCTLTYLETHCLSTLNDYYQLVATAKVGVMLLYIGVNFIFVDFIDV